MNAQQVNEMLAGVAYMVGGFALLGVVARIAINKLIK